jgi:hypothetical protein
MSGDDISNPCFLSTAQVAKLLGISPTRVIQLRRADRLPAKKTSLGYLFLEREVKEFKRERKRSARRKKLANAS